MEIKKLNCVAISKKRNLDDIIWKIKKKPYVILLYRYNSY